MKRSSNDLNSNTIVALALMAGSLVACETPPGAKPPIIDINPTAVVPKGLNDTGAITFISDVKAKPTSSMPPSGYPGQDAAFGPDKTLLGTSAAQPSPPPLYGIKSFKFVALDEKTGAKLVSDFSSNNTPIFKNSKGETVTPGCVMDEVTGLIWEYKNKIPMNTHYFDHVFTWYDPNPATNGGHPGQPWQDSQCIGINSGDHTGLAGDTNSFIQENNAAKLCGFSNWRLPLVQELTSIIDYSGVLHETTDMRYFGNLHGFNNHRWAAETLAQTPKSAWAVHFESGFPEAHSKECTPTPSGQAGFFNAVMLVRSTP